MNELEDGTRAQMGFGKVQEAASRSDRLPIPVVLQHADTGEVLLVGYADDEAMRETWTPVAQLYGHLPERALAQGRYLWGLARPS